MKIFFGLILLITQLTVAQVRNEAEVKADLLKNLDYIQDVFAKSYAPKTWKESFLKWDLNSEITLAKQKVQAAKSVHDYRQAVADFFLSTGDYHVGFSFYSTESAKLPFSVRTIEGKTLVVFIDTDKMPKGSVTLELGDEITAFDNRPVSEVLKELQALVGKSAPQTDAALADMALTSRRGSRNFYVPHGPVEMAFKKPGSEDLKSLQLAWIYTEEKVPGVGFDKTQNVEEMDAFKLKLPMMDSQIAKEYSVADNVHSVGIRKSFLPDFAKRIWETDEKNPFDAYIYQQEDGKLIGVVRIPSYVPKDADEAVAAFADIVKKMQQHTSGLVIDQLNNPGGSVFYLYALASMLTDKSISTPRHHLIADTNMANESVGLLTQLENVKNDADAKTIAKSFAGYPMSFNLVVMIREFANFVINQYKQGKYFTDSFYIEGVDRINPSMVANYTKPIMILVNELDFSGGDFFPAILQDNKRVKVLGTRTSGAGGYVIDTQFQNSFGLSGFRYTGSIAERASGNPIENLGIMPDVQIPMTVEDYRNGFKSYLEKVKAELKKSL